MSDQQPDLLTLPPEPDRWERNQYGAYLFMDGKTRKLYWVNLPDVPLAVRAEFEQVPQ